MNMKKNDAVHHVVGLDIGYGAVKLVQARFSPGNPEPLDMKERIFPVGAGPASRVAVDPDTESRLTPVIINGQPWIAGVSPMAIQSSNAGILHKDYPSTEEYLALYLTALSHVESDVIDLLVTGLPTKQALDPNYYQPLINRLKGKHPLNAQRVVEVRKVVVAPQPLGAYQDLLTREPAIARRPAQHLLVVDPGFYSLDWIVMYGRSPLADRSSSSTDGWSSVLELTAKHLMAMIPGSTMGISRLNEAVRTRTHHEFFLGKAGTIDLDPLFRQYGKEVAKSGVTNMRQVLRHLSDDIAQILICGGAAEYYREAIEEAFPVAVVSISERPQLANARGFLRIGLAMAMQGIQQVA